MNINKLIKQCETVKEVIAEIQRFPHFYLRTDEEKRLNKAMVEMMFNKIKGGK